MTVPWFNVDDGLHDHRKVRKLGADKLAAMGLWGLCGSWCADNPTDGFVPDEIVARYDPEFYCAKRLVDVGLWVEDDDDGEHGYRFHEWAADADGTVRNYTSEEVAAARARKSRAGSLGNHRRWHVKAGVVDQSCRYCSTDPTTDRTCDPSSDPTTDRSCNSPHPIPSHPNKESSARKSRATPLPDDWAPTDIHRSYAKDHGINVEHEAFKFRAHAEANARRQARWNAAFTQWLAHATEYGSRGPSRAEPAASRLEGFVLPECPREIRDDGPAYVKWAKAKRDEWLAGRAT